MKHALKSAVGERAGVSVTSEFGVGLDAAGLTVRCVEWCGDARAVNGSKTRTINGFEVDASAAHTCIVGKEYGLWVTMVPTAEKGTKGPCMV